MKRVKFTPTSTVILNMMAHMEVNAIVDTETGQTFVELPTPNVSDADPEPSKKLNKAEEKVESKKGTKEVPVYTEDEMIDMTVQELLDICENLGINPKDTDGKNTNKKLRLLILEAQGEGDDDEKEVEEVDTPKGRKKVSPLMEIVKAFDTGDLSMDKATKKLVAEGIDEDVVTKALRKLSKDPNIDLEDIVEMMEGEEAEPEEKPAKKSAEGKSKLLNVEDLEAGDEVTVKFDDGEWYEGTVTKGYSSKTETATVKFEDGEVATVSEDDEIKAA